MLILFLFLSYYRCFSPQKKLFWPLIVFSNGSKTSVKTLSMHTTNGNGNLSWQRCRIKHVVLGTEATQWGFQHESRVHCSGKVFHFPIRVAPGGGGMPPKWKYFLWQTIVLRIFSHEKDTYSPQRQVLNYGPPKSSSGSAPVPISCCTTIFNFKIVDLPDGWEMLLIAYDLR